MAEAPMRWRTGGCHCGAVRFEVLAPDEVDAKECNCTICRKAGYLHLIVEKERFRLVEGADKIATYSFNTGTAKHRFCSVCGVKSFYVPRSKPDGYSVNLRCLDDGQVRVARVVSFDGRNWEQAFAAAQGKV
jgi:centromere protein V